ncbi:hypothetical protein NDU88_005069, partial [Pleurodeles waltl]
VNPAQQSFAEGVSGLVEVSSATAYSFVLLEIFDFQKRNKCRNLHCDFIQWLPDNNASTSDTARSFAPLNFIFSNIFLFQVR